MRHQSVPCELYEAACEQLTQALQAIAALAPLTDEEVVACRRAHGNIKSDLQHLGGWAESMRKDMLAPEEYGRDALIDMLSRHEFLTNTHAGFIYGAFEGPQLTWKVGQYAALAADLIKEHEQGVGGESDDCGIDKVKSSIAAKMADNAVPSEYIEYLLRIMGMRIVEAMMERRFGRLRHVQEPPTP